MIKALKGFSSFALNHSDKISLSMFNYVMHRFVLESFIESDAEAKNIIRDTINSSHTLTFKPQTTNEWNSLFIQHAPIHVKPPMKFFFNMVGPSGAGKSTYCKRLKSVLETDVTKVGIISRDTFIVDNFKWAYPITTNYNELYHACFKDSMNNPTADKEFDAFCAKVIEENDIVLIDMTNLTLKSRLKWCRLGKPVNAYITNVWFETPKEQCKLNQHTSLRTKRIDAGIIEDMFDRVEFPLLGFDCNRIIVVDDNSFFL